MAVFCKFTVMCVIFLAKAVHYAGAGESSSSHGRPFKTIYAFGDSFTDTGNTHSNTGPAGFMFVSNPPYGRTYFRRPTNRYSDGRLVIDFLAEELGLPFLPPYLDRKADRSAGVNFAVAGSTAIAHSFFVKNNMTLNITPQSLQTQLGWFDEFLRSKGCRDQSRCTAPFDDALIWVGEIGVNDYAYSLGSSFSPEAIGVLAINSVSAFLEALLEKGAKYVVVQGMLPSGCLTLSMFVANSTDRDASGCVASANRHGLAHNAALKAKITHLRRKFPRSTIVYADYYEAYMAIVKNPRRHGIKDVFAACCGYGGGKLNFDYFNVCGSPSARSCAAPSQYMNWDGVHLTEATYRAIATEFLDGSYTQPPLPHLFSRKQRSG